MRKVVDSNYLMGSAAPARYALREYLSKSTENIVVLTDYAAMEVHTGKTFQSICESMAVLTKYPTQVIVLKNTGIVCGMNGRGSGLQKRLIDANQTKEFHIYCQQLSMAQFGEISIQKQLIAKESEATKHLEKMLFDAEGMPTIIADIAKIYSKEELLRLRSGVRNTDDMLRKLLMGVIEVAKAMFENHPNVRRWPDRSDLPNTYIFRAALCAYLLALDWISVGGAQGVKSKILRNDMVDVSFAAYATFFDGLLSNDKKVQRIYLQARRLLDALPGCHISGAK